MPATPLNVAIIGAGIAGLTLALTLSRSSNVTVTIYESHHAPGRTIGGNISLGPNGCNILQRLDLLDELRAHSIECKTVKFFDNVGNFAWEAVVGDKQLFGHNSLRVKRDAVINTLLSAVYSKQIPIICSKKFTKIDLESSSEGITFSFADGTSVSADLLVGADGIHSKVRKQLYPDIEPRYIGSIALGTLVNAEPIMPLIRNTDPKCSADPIRPDKIGLFTGPYGTAFLLTHNTKFDTLLMGLQVKFPDLSRVELEELQADPKRMHAILAKDRDTWVEHIRVAMDAASDSKDWFLWPLKLMPALPSWLSEQKRVVLVADAAHAMMPAAGQGANLALEDDYFLGRLVNAVSDGTVGAELGSALQFWEELRRDRVDQVLEVAKGMNKLREQGSNKVHKQTLRGITRGEKDEADGMQHLDWLFGGVTVQEARVEEWERVNGRA